MRFHQQGKILFKVLGALAGLVFMGFGVQERMEHSRIHKSGKRAVVEPIEQYTEFKKSGSSLYTAEFHFTTADGQAVVTKHSFPEEVLEDFKAERPVEVIYEARDPTSFVFASEKPSWTLVIVGALIFLAAIIFA